MQSGGKTSRQACNRGLVSIIIPVFNRWDPLPACIESIQKQSYGPIEIIIVDDGSTTPPPAEIRHMNESLRLIELPRNFGPGHARNRGYLESHGEYLHFLDSDTILPHADVVSSAVAFLQKHPNAGAVGGEILVPDGVVPASKVLGRRIGLLGRTYYIGLLRADRIEDDATMPCDYLASCNLLLPRAVFETVGGFDPYFGFGAEDVELGRRIGRAGLSLHISRRCAVFHYYLPGGRSRHLNYRYDLTRLREVFKSEPLTARLLFSIITVLRIVAFYPLLPIKLACYVAMRQPIRRGHFDSGFFLAKAFARAIRELSHTLRRRGLDFLAPRRSSDSSALSRREHGCYEAAGQGDCHSGTAHVARPSAHALAGVVSKPQAPEVLRFKDAHVTHILHHKQVQCPLCTLLLLATARQ